MGVIADGFQQAFRNYATDAVPASGVNDPSKSEARALGSVIESYVSGQLVEAVAEGGAFRYVLDVSRDESTVLTTGTRKYVLRAAHAISNLRLRASLSTASSSGDVDLDVKAAGVSLLTSPLTIDQGAKSTVGSASPAVFAATDIADDAEISIDVPACGTGAKGLKVWLSGTISTFGALQTPYFVATGGIGSGGTFTSIDVPFPSGVQPDDIAIMKVIQFNSGAPSANFTRPSGWTTMYAQADQDNGRCIVYWKRCEGTETGNQQVHTDANVTGLQGDMAIWRNCVALGDPFEALASTTGNATAMSGSDVTTLGDNRRVVSDYVSYSSNASDPDIGWTEIYDEGSSGAAFGQFAASAQAVPDSGTTITAESRTRISSIFGAGWFSYSYALIGSVLA